MVRNLNIIDLISEKHITLRREVEERWSKSGEEDITHKYGENFISGSSETGECIKTGNA